MQWALEIVGVGALAFGALLWWPPLAFVVIGAYLILAAHNTGGE